MSPELRQYTVIEWRALHPDDFVDQVREAQGDFGPMMEVYAVGVALGSLMDHFGADPETVSKYQFLQGRLSLGRDPWLAGTMAWNDWVQFKDAEEVTP